jgi:hypothetical protein
MVSEAQGREGQVVEICRGFHGVPAGSRVFLAPRWMMLEKVLGVDVVRHWLYLADKPSHIGVDEDGLSFPLHRPTVCSHRTRGHGFLSGASLIPSPQWVVAPFQGMRSPWTWIFGGVLVVRVPVVLSYCIRHSMSQFSEDLSPMVPTRYWTPPGATAKSPGMSRAGF